MDDRATALAEMKATLRAFVSGGIDVRAFVKRFEPLFSVFDPEPDRLEGMGEDAIRQFEVFAEFRQGTWGGPNPNIPWRSDWKYGVEDEPYSWVDGDAFRRLIRQTLLSGGVDIGLNSGANGGEE